MGHVPKMEKPTRPDELGGPIPVKVHGGGCLDRIPYASLMATVMCFIGVILFSIMMSWGFNATAEQTKRTLRITEWPWLDKVQIFFVVLTVLMSLFALFFLLVGFTATGSTRERLYKEKQAKFGGRCALVLSMALTVALLGCWLVILSFDAIICSAYYTFDDVCYNMPGFTDSDCIDFGVFEPLIRGFSSASLQLCGGDAQQFCALSATARSWYIVGWVGALIVCLGLCLFLAIHAANYAHVGNASRYVELRDLFVDPAPTPPSYPPPPVRYVEGPSRRSRERKNSYNDSLRYPPSENSSTTRLAEQMSDSVSQYQYGRKFYR